MLKPDKLRQLESEGDAWTGCGDVAGEWRRACTLYDGCEAICWPEGSWSYAELGRRIESLAVRLKQAGVRRGDRIGVSCVELRYWPLALLAIATVGAVYLPLDRRVPEGRLRSMVKDAGVIVMVGDEESHAMTFACRWVAVELDSDDEAGQMVDGYSEQGGLLALLYTSGSTGQPKGVMVEHAGVINEVMAVARMIGVGPGERMLQFSSPGFDASVEEMLSCLLSGAVLVPRSLDAVESFECFLSYVIEKRVTVLNLPTAFWASWCGWMMEMGKGVPAGVRVVIVGGERLSGRALRDWMECGGRQRVLLNTYGPTEASIAATAQLIHGSWNEDGDPPIGRPLTGYLVRVVDEDGERVKNGESGELWLGGLGVGPGYWNRDAQTAAAFFEMEGERWYRTGDLVKWDDEGRLVFGGRIDAQVKILGHRIEPDEVIRVLESHPRVAAAHIAGIEHDGSIMLAAWVKWVGEVPNSWVGELGEYLRVRLGSASVPLRWALVKEFALTERGKLDRRALPEPELLGGLESAPPEGETEKRLAGIWQNLLGIDRLGRDDDFFDLGGTSLLALRLFGRIAQDFGISLPMAELLRAPCLKGLAELLDASVGERVREPGIPVVTPLRAGDDKVPLFCVHGGDGGVLFYRQLAELLPEGLPLFSIESPELSAEGRVSERTIEEMGKSYLQAVRKKQEKGPYYLAGYSFGGVMVYEMARQLCETGEEVAFLALLDTENPAAGFRRYGCSERLQVFWRATFGYDWWTRSGLLASRMFDGVATHLRVKSEQRAVREAGQTPPHSNLRMLQVRELHSEAMDAYRPQALDLKVLLFKTEAVNDKFEVADDYGWRSLVRELQIVTVPGEHLTMFDQENVGNLADRVSEHL